MNDFQAKMLSVKSRVVTVLPDSPLLNDGPPQYRDPTIVAYPANAAEAELRRAVQRVGQGILGAVGGVGGVGEVQPPHPWPRNAPLPNQLIDVVNEQDQVVADLIRRLATTIQFYNEMEVEVSRLRWRMKLALFSVGGAIGLGLLLVYLYIRFVGR